MRKNIEMTVTAEGLRTELPASAKRTLFDGGNSASQSERAEMLALLAEELGRVPSTISVKVHIDATGGSRVQL